MEPIFAYTDYRKYLVDFYAMKKKQSDLYSYRTFSKVAEIRSPSLFKEVVNGKRSLTLHTIPGFIKGLGLKGDEARYFTALVNFNQAKSQTARMEFFNQMRGALPRIRPTVVPSDHFAYYANWYNAVVRELVATCDWKENYQQLAHAILPNITAKEAKESIALLIDLGFIRQGKNGSYQQTDPAITTGPEITSIGVRKRNTDLSKIAVEAIEEFGPESRDISSQIIGISSKGYGLIKREIQKFRQRVAEIALEDKHSNQVYGMNMQLFPLSKKCPHSKDKA